MDSNAPVATALRDDAHDMQRERARGQRPFAPIPCSKPSPRGECLHHGCITRRLARHQMPGGVWSSLLALAVEHEKGSDMDRFAMFMCACFIVITAYHADLAEKLSSLSEHLQVDHMSYRAAERVVRATQTSSLQMYLAEESSAFYFPVSKRVAVLKEPVQAELASAGDDGSCVLSIFCRDVAFSSAEREKCTRVIRA